MTNQPESSDERIQELLGKLKDSSMTEEEWKEFVNLTHEEDDATTKKD